MILAEYGFSEYYHKYIIFEADSLTDFVKKKVKVSDDDCYMLCSCYIAEDGLLSFNVLSIGSSKDKCTKGLRKKEMLAIFGADFVIDLECEIVEPSIEMIKKNKSFIEMMEQNTDDDLVETRFDDRLDDIRDYFFPDIVEVGFLTPNSIIEMEMKIIAFDEPFLKGRLISVPPSIKQVSEDDIVQALPYYSDGNRLIAIFAGDKLSPEAKKQLKELKKLGRHAVFGFSKPILRS